MNRAKKLAAYVIYHQTQATKPEMSSLVFQRRLPTYQLVESE